MLLPRCKGNPLYSGLSVEFNAERETRRNGLRVITRAFLDGAQFGRHAVLPIFHR